jgi:hypothetical protein
MNGVEQPFPCGCVKFHRDETSFYWSKLCPKHNKEWSDFVDEQVKKKKKEKRKEREERKNLR